MQCGTTTAFATSKQSGKSGPLDIETSKKENTACFILNGQILLASNVNTVILNNVPQIDNGSWEKFMKK